MVESVNTMLVDYCVEFSWKTDSNQCVSWSLDKDYVKPNQCVC